MNALRTVSNTIVILISIVLLFPLLWAVINAFRDPFVLSKIPPVFKLTDFTMMNFVMLTKYPILKWFTNTLYVTVATAVGAVVINSLAGYAFAKKHIPAKEVIFWTLMASMMIPGMVTLMPGFLLRKSLGFVDKLYGLVVPGLFSVGTMFFYRQYVMRMPDEVLYVAEIDGCGELRKWWYVVLPMTAPAIATILVLGFVAGWNDFMWPLMMLFSREKMTLSIGISQVLYDEAARSMERLQTNYGLMLAGAVIMFLPMFLVYLGGHKYFVRGLWGGGVKE